MSQTCNTLHPESQARCELPRFHVPEPDEDGNWWDHAAPSAGVWWNEPKDTDEDQRSEPGSSDKVREHLATGVNSLVLAEEMGTEAHKYRAQTQAQMYLLASVAESLADIRDVALDWAKSRQIVMPEGMDLKPLTNSESLKYFQEQYDKEQVTLLENDATDMHFDLAREVGMDPYTSTWRDLISRVGDLCKRPQA